MAPSAGMLAIPRSVTGFRSSLATEWVCPSFFFLGLSLMSVHLVVDRLLYVLVA